MPELRSGLLWRMDARTKEAAAAEWEHIKDRFRERYGTEPVGAVIGEKAVALLDQAHDAGLLRPSGVLALVARNIIDNEDSAWWVHMHNDEEE
jgi:hypothetical protein